LGDTPLVVGVRVLPHACGLELPKYATPGAAGLDLRAAVSGEVVLEPGQRKAVPTGVILSIPEGFEGQVRPRSGLARDYGLTVLNTPGTIDSDYRGEVAVLVINLGSAVVSINRGERIAQLIIAPVTSVVLDSTTAIPETDRATGGFGHTGAS